MASLVTSKTFPPECAVVLYDGHRRFCKEHVKDLSVSERTSGCGRGTCLLHSHG